MSKGRLRIKKYGRIICVTLVQLGDNPITNVSVVALLV